MKPNVSPLIIPLMRQMVDDDVIFCYECYNHVCPFCEGKLNANGRYLISINKCIDVEKQQYICKKGNKSLITDIDFVDKNYCYMEEIYLKGLNISLIDYMSLEKMSEIIGDFYGHAPARQTILNNINKNYKEFITKEEKKIEKELKKANIKPSGVYHYDEQYLFVSKDLYLRLIILDNKTKMIIAEELVHNNKFNKKFVKKFIHNNLKNLPLKGIITDGVNYYPEIIDELGVEHQLCNFHKMQNLMNLVYKTLNRKKLKIKKLKEKTLKNEKKIDKTKNEQKTVKKGKIPKADKKRQQTHKKIKKLQKTIKNNKKEIKQLKKEIKYIEKNINKIKLILNSKTTKTSKKRFKKLEDTINELPHPIATFIKKLSKNFERSINHIKNKFLPNTNNLLECYIGITLPRYLKKRYKTPQGIKKRLKLSKIRWIKRNVLP
ncbi:MAG: hypothetical protein LBU40_00905 [Methanobrevibacter sp.]|nr:hypothetical protein [Methanobrevibacter sp.]